MSEDEVRKSAFLLWFCCLWSAVVRPVSCYNGPQEHLSYGYQ